MVIHGSLLLVIPPINMRTGPDFEYQGWGIFVPWIECGGWKGWCKDLERLNAGCIREGTGYTTPWVLSLVLELAIFVKAFSNDIFSLWPVPQREGPGSANSGHTA